MERKYLNISRIISILVFNRQMNQQKTDYLLQVFLISQFNHLNTTHN